MGRQRFNKREHIEESNRLFESTYNKTKGSLTQLNEQIQDWGPGIVRHAKLYSCGDNSNSGLANSCGMGPIPNSSQQNLAFNNLCLNVTDSGGSPFNMANGPIAFVEYQGQIYRMTGTGAGNQINSCSAYGLSTPPESATVVTACKPNAPGGNAQNISPYFDPNVQPCNQTQTQGDWWCDPTGAYVNPNGGNCIQSPNQPQTYFTGPYVSEADCNAQCSTAPTCMNVKTQVCGDPSSTGQWPCATIDGVVPDQTYLGKVIDAGTSNAAGPVYYEITNIDPSTQSPYGTQDFPEIPGGCPGASNSSANCDFSWTSTCSQTHLQTGGASSWQNMLTQREIGFNSAGCQHFQSMVNWVTDQLNSGVAGNGSPLTQVQIDRKNEQLDWAQCQANECGCGTLNMPALTGGPTPPPNDPDLIDPEVPKDFEVPSLPPQKKKPKTKDIKSLNEERKRMIQMWKHKL